MKDNFTGTIVIMTIIVSSGILTITQQHVSALTNHQRYTQGYNDAMEDCVKHWILHSIVTNGFPYDHTLAYQKGYKAGASFCYYENPDYKEAVPTDMIEYDTNNHTATYETYSPCPILPETCSNHHNGNIIQVIHQNNFDDFITHENVTLSK